jgi:hypothetical protein
VIAAPVPLAPAPPAVRLVCRRRIDYSEFRAMCPAVWPRSAGAGFVPVSSSIRGPRVWRAAFDDRSGASEVVVGERRMPFPVDLEPGAAFPDARQLGLANATVLATATVHGLPALVLQVPPAGRVAVVWNPEEHGALVSLRLGGSTRADRVSAALKMAASWRPSGR